MYAGPGILFYDDDQQVALIGQPYLSKTRQVIFFTELNNNFRLKCFL